MKKYDLYTGNIMQCSDKKWFGKIISGTFDGPLTDVVYQENAVLVRDCHGYVVDVTKLSLMDIMCLNLKGSLHLLKNMLNVQNKGNESGNLFVDLQSINLYIPKNEQSTSLIALRRAARRQYSIK